MEKLLLGLLVVVGVCSGQLLNHQRPQTPTDTQLSYLETYDYDDLSDGHPHPGAGAVSKSPAPNSLRRILPSTSSSKSQPGRLNPGQQFQGVDCRGKTRTRPHEKYCDLYYHTTGCDDGQALLRSCPNGLVYTGSGRHGLINVCDYPHRSDCQGREKHNPPISTEHCDWLYGIFGHESSCTRYWTCWNGTATEQFCVGGLLYNEETHACDWPQNVGGCQKHPLCKDDANGNVPLGKSCNRYWACQGGYPRLQRCPAMLVFDRTRKRCVSPPTEDCDVPPTTSRPKSNNDNGQDQGSEDRRRGGGDGHQRRGGPQQERRGGGGGEGLQHKQQNLPFNLPEGAQLLSRPQN